MASSQKRRRPSSQAFHRARKRRCSLRAGAASVEHGGLGNSHRFAAGLFASDLLNPMSSVRVVVRASKT